MRKMCISAVVLMMVLLLNIVPSYAITINMEPLSQDVTLGSAAVAGIRISGLGAGVAPSLSAFDMDVSYNPSILNLNSVVFGDPVLGDQLDIFGLGSLTATSTGAGSVNMFELSFDLPDDLNNLQSGDFILATLTFNTLTTGTSPLNLSVNALGDANGDPLAATLQSGNVNVVPVVPEPSTILLLGIGLAGIGYLRRKKILK